MAAQERLTVEQTRTDDLLAAHHLHRYEWAAALCKGQRVVDLACGVGYGSEVLRRAASAVVGVDRDAATVATARRHFGAQDISFVQADAGSFLRGITVEDHDVVVCFEGLEHFDDLPDVLDELRRLARRGVRLLLSLPNEDKFVEDNHFHVQSFGFTDVRGLTNSFPDAVVLQQFLAEGSVIAVAGGDLPASTRAQVTSPERFEPDYANHWLIAVGFDVAQAAAATSRMAVATAPNYNSYMRALERANAELRRLNFELAQQHLGLRDAAAAGRAEKWTRLEDQLVELRTHYDAPRYRALDAVRARALRVPGLSVTWWNLRRAVGARRASSR